MNKNCIFIGRWQPPHYGHMRLIAKRIRNNNVIIAIRNTKRSSTNPLSYRKRKKILKKLFPSAKIIKIPDIDEICYGRDVGYEITEIKLSKEIENISATKIRNGNLDLRTIRGRENKPC